MHKPKVTLINVLDREYYNDCHIPESVNIPLDELRDVVSKWDKDREIVVYCAHKQCPRSRDAWHELWKLGFSKARAYEGGIREWREKGYPTKGACRMDYLTMPLINPLPPDEAVATISAEELKKLL
jgi:rhodanese-related sulfurtransferase